MSDLSDFSSLLKQHPLKAKATVWCCGHRFLTKNFVFIIRRNRHKIINNSYPWISVKCDDGW